MIFFVHQTINREFICDESIVTLLKNFKGLVVIDEAYIDFQKPSWLVELDEYPNLIITNTFKSLWFSRNSLGICYASTVHAVLTRLSHNHSK
jgi:histidinol-phosphate aminotransferase